jgi:farnesyl diphosphate synthase
MIDADLSLSLGACAGEVDGLLAAMMDRLDAAASAPGRKRLIAAMRHASVSGGKRIRPFLAMETAKCLVSGKPGAQAALHSARLAGLAVELIHCYSLAHDDLPSMDNDLLRRGQPTVHVAFDEATAILAGDALQTLAFETLGETGDAQLGLDLVRILARASGEAGMAGGQMLDLAAEGRFEAGAPQRLPLEGISEVQSLKTGAIIIAAVEMGAVCGGMSSKDAAYDLLLRYAAHLGRAFQIADDVIDATGDAQTAGKAVAKDAAAGKATFVSALGLDGARQRLNREIAEGLACLAQVPANTRMLAALLQSMATRRS